MKHTIRLAITVAASLSAVAYAQTWVSTATKALTPVLTNVQVGGSLASSTSMHIVVGLKVRNANQIQPTLKAMLTPGNSLYGTSLSVSQFVSQFAPTTAQAQAVENYLSSSSCGFTNVTLADNRLLIEADATAGQVDTCFNTGLVNVTRNGKTYFANTLDAQVPSSLSGTVLCVLGLNNISGVHSDIRKLTTSAGATKSKVSPATDPCAYPDCPVPDVDNETYGPQDYQIAYDARSATPAPPAPAPTVEPAWASVCESFTAPQLLPTGKCTAIGIIAEGDLGTVSPKSPNGPGDPSSSSTGVIHDLYQYEHYYGLPAVPVTIVYAGIESPDTSGIDEWDLDSQTSTGIANQVEALYFYVATSLTDSDIGLAINKAVSQNKVKAFNMSFGECEFFPYIDGAMLLDDEMFGEAALQGMTPFASSDDQGSACPVEGTNGVPLSGPPDTSYPASSPYVIASGGTNLFTCGPASDGSTCTTPPYTYDYEVAWEASGGGPSYFETAPFWQGYTGSGSVPVVLSYEAGDRGVPDVAMCAGGTELAICAADIFVSGTATLVGGTSLSSPLSMGSWARIESSHSNKLGFAGPLIYQLANGAPTLTSPFFNDVLTGANGLYSALPGWDYVTGLGSWDIKVVNEKIPTSYPK